MQLSVSVLLLDVCVFLSCGKACSLGAKFSGKVPLYKCCREGRVNKFRRNKSIIPQNPTPLE